MFEAFSMLLIESEMPVRRAAKVINIHNTRLWRIFKYWVSLAVSRDSQREKKSLGIDETSTKKGHNYITLEVDMKERRVIYATEGKGSDTLTELKNHLEKKGCPIEQIESICMDMSPSFISGTMANFQHAKITFDKFHIM
jgi:transposase